MPTVYAKVSTSLYNMSWSINSPGGASDQPDLGATSYQYFLGTSVPVTMAAYVKSVDGRTGHTDVYQKEFGLVDNYSYKPQFYTNPVLLTSHATSDYSINGVFASGQIVDYTYDINQTESLTQIVSNPGNLLEGIARYAYVESDGSKSIYNHTVYYPSYFWTSYEIKQTIYAKISGPPTVVEGDVGSQEVSYTVTLSAPAASEISLEYHTSNETAIAGEDYNQTSGKISFNPGEQSKQIKLSVFGDTNPEPIKRYNLGISNPVSSANDTLLIDFSGATVNTAIVDQLLPTSEGALKLMGDIFGKRSEYFRPLAEIIADTNNPAVESQLDAIDNTIGRFGGAIGTAAPFAGAASELRQQLDAAGQITNNLQREQTEWLAFRDYHTAMYSESMKFALSAGIGAYFTAYGAATAATVAGGVEVFLASAAAAAGVSLSSASVIAAGAFIASNPLLVGVAAAAAATIVYEQYFEQSIKTDVQQWYDTFHPVPTRETVPFEPVKLLRNGLDPDFYSGIYQDVKVSGMDPADHYYQYGWHEGRDPNALFSTTGYLAANQDVAKAGMNPLTHYDLYGWPQSRDPSASFDNELYLARNADVAAAGMNPLTHFLQYGQAEGRQAYAAVGKASDLARDPGFDAEYYLLANPDVARAALNAGGDTFEFAHQHYETYGWQYGRNPNAVFDTKGYLAANPDVAAAGMDPLEHYHKYGFSEGRDPSAQFDTKAYLAANPDVKAVGYDPMLHYLQYGAVEGRTVFNDGHFG